MPSAPLECCGSTRQSAQQVGAARVDDAGEAVEITVGDDGEEGRVRSAGTLRTWWRSRVGRQLLQEMLLMFGLFLFYKFVRLMASGQEVEAFKNARDVIQLERHLGIFNETTLQAVVLHSRGIVRFFNTYYVSVHFIVMIVTLIAFYVRYPDGYARSRRILLVMTSIALVIYVTYPAAPPRMFPVLGFVDTGQLVGPGAYAPGSVFRGVANQFAAVPSMHFGWAVLVAWAVITYAHSRYRYLMLLHPLLTLLAIVLTANHYWLDAIIAAVIFVVVLWAEQRFANAFHQPHLRRRPELAVVGANDSGSTARPLRPDQHSCLASARGVVAGQKWSDDPRGGAPPRLAPKSSEVRSHDGTSLTSTS